MRFGHDITVEHMMYDWITQDWREEKFANPFVEHMIRLLNTYGFKYFNEDRYEGLFHAARDLHMDLTKPLHNAIFNAALDLAEEYFSDLEL
jgi:hypothetical protein